MAVISGTAVPLLLDRRDEAERTCIQLYDHVIGDVDLTGKDVLEVSSGRGGGASYVSRYLGPRSVVGVDISPRAIAFCRRVHKTPGLSFRVGDAEGIPAEDDSVDAVINVEASFCYANLDVFLAEVTRVLRPGGHFFYTDLRLSDEIDDWMAALRRCDLDLLHVEDITENVVHALEIDERRRTIAADRLSPIMLRQAMRTFSGAKGTRYPTLLKDRRLQYYSFVLRKNGACAAAVPFSS
jgi:SAM-dependent methyltransferase